MLTGVTRPFHAPHALFTPSTVGGRSMIFIVPSSRSDVTNHITSPVECRRSLRWRVACPDPDLPTGGRPGHLGGRAGPWPAARAGGLPVKVRVDTEKCQGHGRCFGLAPDLFDLDDFGTSSVTGDGTVSPDRERVVRLVAANCPEFAVEIVGR
jgi:ferredoxin